MTLNKSTITESLLNILAKVSRFRLLLFVLLVACVYSYILFTINSLSGVEPTQETVNARKDPIAAAQVDKRVISQLRQLEDNSVSVRELFDSARNNPFQE